MVLEHRVAIGPMAELQINKIVVSPHLFIVLGVESSIEGDFWFEITVSKKGWIEDLIKTIDEMKCESVEEEGA